MLNQKLGFLPTVGVSYQNNIQYMSVEANIFSDNAVDIPSSLVAGNINIPFYLRKWTCKGSRGKNSAR